MDPIVDEDVQSFLNLRTNFLIHNSILVTGANGMLGGYHIEFYAQLARQLGRPLELFAVTRRPSRYLESLAKHYSPYVKIVELNKLKEIKITTPSHIIHAASPASPENFNGNEWAIIETNVVQTLELLQIVPPNSHFSYFSSGEVNGPNPELPTTETSFSGFDHLSIRGTYPEMKRAAEVIIKSLSGDLSVSSSFLRIYHTFGPGINLNQQRIFSTVIRALIDEIPITLHSNGLAKRAFLYSADLFQATQLIAENRASGAFNVASELEISILDFAKLASKVNEDQSPVEFTHNSSVTEQSSASRAMADISKIKNFGWSQEHDVSEAISRTLRSAKWRKSFGY